MRGDRSKAQHCHPRCNDEIKRHSGMHLDSLCKPREPAMHSTAHNSERHTHCLPAIKSGCVLSRKPMLINPNKTLMQGWEH